MLAMVRFGFPLGLSLRIQFWVRRCLRVRGVEDSYIYDSDREYDDDESEIVGRMIMNLQLLGC